MPTATLAVNRRQFERFHTQPMYTRVQVHTTSHPSRTLEGHVYDISEGGLRFELDQALDPGTSVAIRLELPHWLPAPIDTDVPPSSPASVTVLARIIWTDDDEIPGPVRMAASFTGYLDIADRERLLDTLAAGALRRAA